MKDALGAVQTILVLGGTSEIGLAAARELSASRSATVVLAGRDLGALEAAAETLRAAGAGRVDCVAFDAEDTDGHEGFVKDVVNRVGDLDVVIMAFGILGDQAADEEGGEGAVRVARVNYVGAVSAGLPLARQLRHQGHGTLVVLSSIAGERARRSNFIYGSSKAGLDAFAQGLGDWLAGSGARVVVVRPGFVHSRMTAGMKPAPLATTPDVVAAAIARAIQRGTETVWVPAPLRIVAFVLRHLPRPVFRRLPI